MSSAPFELNHQIVRAGAGAGKTTTLTKTVMETALSFDHSQGRFPRIVVTTFTRKATQELRERLVAGAVATGRNDFLDYVSSRSNLHISTIHGVLSLFLRRYGHLLNWTRDSKYFPRRMDFAWQRQCFANSFWRVRKHQTWLKSGR